MRCLLPLLLLTACEEKKEPVDEEETATPDDTAPPDDTDTGDPLPPADLCADEGLTVRSFDPAGASGDFGEVVPDFTWETTEGPWTLSEAWTGCDSYVAINYYGAGDYPVQMGSRADIEAWLETSPRNVHYFFLSYDAEADVAGALADVQASVDEALDTLDGDLADHWRERIHYVSDSAWTADWIGSLNQAYYEDGAYVQWGAAIDRFQQAREVGYLCDPSDGWATCPPWFLSYEPVYFNFESDRQDALDAAGDVTVLPVFADEPASDPGWAGQRIVAEVELPDAATMATFDTLELDLELACAGYPALTSCPAWDYLVYAYLCEVDDLLTEEDESSVCSTEIGRWVTTYWRPGRWVHDVTPFLALLQDGGKRKIAFYTQQYYNVSLDLRLSNQGKGYRPVGMEYLYGGGWFGATYNWGVSHDIDSTTWTIGSHDSDTVEYAISTVDPDAGFLTAEESGGWHRFDWVWADDALYVCHAAEDLADEAAASASTFGCTEDDPKTKESERTCWGADHADLAAGCNMGAWSPLTPSPGGKAPLPYGGWQEVWHAEKMPRTFTPPAGTARVEVAAVVSGHGFGDTSANCAEFCDHQHQFSVGGSEYTKTHPEAGSLLGCAEQVAIGTVPNQAGTWIYGRGGWCPGLEVPVWRQDITADVDLGGANTLSYLGLMDGEIWQSTAGNPRIDMVSYLVYYQ